MNHNKQLIINEITKKKVIAIIRGVKSEHLLQLLTVLYDNGITCAEITFGKKEDEQIFEDLKLAISNFGDKMFLGAGTVTTENRMKLALKAGCEYLISPILNDSLIDFCSQNNLVSVIGALTPSEIKHALDKGADFVKVFPSSAFGPRYFKDVKAPLGDIPLIAFGGVDLQNASDFINAGAVAVGIGSALIDNKLIDKGEFQQIANICKKLVSQVNN